jgi:hypothetical protein
LEVNGYKVSLTGINSVKASTTSGYDVIVVRGPIYAVNASRSVKSYLNALKSSKGTKIAVFASGQDPEIAKNKSLLMKEAAPLPEGSQLKMISVTKFISGESINRTSAVFVDTLLK